MTQEISSRDWFGKSSAGLVLGFVLAVGAAGLFRQAMGLKEAFFSTQGQFSMWLMSPVWAGVLSFCFLFPSTRAAWGWLGLASGIVWATLFALGAVA